MIYDRYTPNGVDYVELATLIKSNNEIEYWVNPDTEVNYKWRVFTELQSVIDFATDREWQNKDVKATTLLSKGAFKTQMEFDMYISSLCQDMNDLTEIVNY